MGINLHNCWPKCLVFFRVVLNHRIRGGFVLHQWDVHWADGRQSSVNGLEVASADWTLAMLAYELAYASSNADCSDGSDAIHVKLAFVLPRLIAWPATSLMWHHLGSLL